MLQDTDKLLQMISERTAITDAQGEVELDIDSLDTATLRLLQRFVAQCLKRPPPVVPGVPAPLPVASVSVPTPRGGDAAAPTPRGVGAGPSSNLERVAAAMAAATAAASTAPPPAPPAESAAAPAAAAPAEDESDDDVPPPPPPAY